MLNPTRHPDGPPAPCPLGFTIDGAHYTLPELSTRTWLDALSLAAPGCWWQLIPLALPTEQAERLANRLFNPTDRFDLDDAEHAATTVLARACGVEFWAATRLAGVLRANWFTFDGYATTVGFNPYTEPIARVLAASYAWRRSMCEKKSEVTRLDSDVWAPPPPTTAAGNPRVAEPDGWNDDMEAAVFEQAMSQMGGARRG